MGMSHESSDSSQTVDIQEGQDDLDVGEANISSTAMPTADSSSMLSVETVVPSTDDIEEEEDPCNTPSTNTMLDENHRDPSNTTLSFAPGEGKRPVFHEPLAECLCFPTIFCGQECSRNA